MNFIVPAVFKQTQQTNHISTWKNNAFLEQSFI
jgi:hypothetical protein